MIVGKDNFQRDSTNHLGFNVGKERYVERAEIAMNFEYIRIKINARNESTTRSCFVMHLFLARSQG
jgi:hypothetical protein